MESSQVTIFGDSEECSSSESGWTMYLASPMHADDDDGHGDGEVEDGGGDDDDDKRNKLDDHDNDDDDNDSMASDASSGPAQEKYNSKFEKENGSKKNQKLEPRKDERNERKGSKKEQGATSFHGKSKVRKGKD